MRGDLSRTSVAEVVRGLADAAATGAVEISGPHGYARMHFREGRVTGAASPARRARLGDRLVNAGLLDQAELDGVLRAQRRAQDRVKLGALLVDEDLVSHDAVRVFIQEQILDAVFEIARWRSGEYDFRIGQPGGHELPVAVPAELLLTEVARRQHEWDQIEAVVASLDGVPDFVLSATSASASLEPDEFAVLATVDGDRSIRELAGDLGYSEFEAARIVYGLVRLGVIEVADVKPDVDVGAALDDALTSPLPRPDVVGTPRHRPGDDDLAAPAAAQRDDLDRIISQVEAVHGEAPAPPDLPRAPVRADDGDVDTWDAVIEADLPLQPGPAAPRVPRPPAPPGSFTDRERRSDDDAAPDEPASDDPGSTAPDRGTVFGGPQPDTRELKGVLSELSRAVSTPTRSGPAPVEPPADQLEPDAAPRPEPRSAVSRGGPAWRQGHEGDVSEFLRELSRLAVDDQAGSGASRTGGATGPVRTSREDAEAPAPRPAPRARTTPARTDKRDDPPPRREERSAKRSETKKRRRFFGRG